MFARVLTQLRAAFCRATGGHVWLRTTDFECGRVFLTCMACLTETPGWSFRVVTTSTPPPHPRRYERTDIRIH